MAGLAKKEKIGLRTHSFLGTQPFVRGLL